VSSRSESCTAALQRVVIEALTPCVDGGRFAAKRVLGDCVRLEADAFTDGHDLVAAIVDLAAPDGGTSRLEMVALGNDRYGARVVPDELGLWTWRVTAWVDHAGSWYRDLLAFAASGSDLTAHLQDGLATLSELRSRVAAQHRHTIDAAAAAVRAAIDAPPDAVPDEPEWRTHADLTSAVALARGTPSPDATSSATALLRVDPPLAATGVWYELFPRSTSPEESRAGTLADVVRRLPYVAALGVDVLYLPPIHPIGRVHRKGPNNTLQAGPDDPGSPWAIGAAEGGHDAVHPGLGTLDDLQHLVVTARRHHIEIALDLALQAAPDHPWVAEHPEWFVQRADGTIRYAENPPKRYEDIYPLDLAGPHREGLWRAVRDVVQHWIDAGVRVFRVDNPHTKPFDFWEWLIADVHRRDPDVVFLSEAFTRPKVMHRLAKLGFTQSYTYFTWRASKYELVEYFEELAHGPGRDYFRPNVWLNTPDILAQHLQTGTRATFLARLLLAAGLSASYGFYGPVFELMEREPRGQGSEEYLHCEKYEVRHWDLDAPASLAPFIGHLNRVRRAHPALRRNDTLRFHTIDNDQIVAWSKTDEASGDAVLAFVSLDPAYVQSGWTALDLGALGIAGEDEPFGVRDLLTGATYAWRGSRNFVRLDPTTVPGHVFEIVQGE
jgi:starch synthase (maltosyl-transferring)